MAQVELGVHLQHGSGCAIIVDLCLFILLVVSGVLVDRIHPRCYFLICKMVQFDVEVG